MGLMLRTLFIFKMSTNSDALRNAQNLKLQIARKKKVNSLFQKMEEPMNLHSNLLPREYLSQARQKVSK